MRRAFPEWTSVFAAGILTPILLAGCQPTYSPDTYASQAAQQANKVDKGVVIGVRAVGISADTTLITGTTAAAGGIAGSQIGTGAGGAFGALGGTVAGGVVGNVVGHAQGDTDGYEYVVQKDGSSEMISVTQKDVKPLGVGAHVLVIEGPQARIVPDYTVPVVSQPLHPDTAKPADAGKPAPEPAKGNSDAAKPAADTAAETPKPAADATPKAVEAAPIPAPSSTASSSPAPASSTTPTPIASPLPPAGSTPAASSPAPAKPDDTASKPGGS